VAKLMLMSLNVHYPEILRAPFILQSCGMYFIHWVTVGDHLRKGILYYRIIWSMHGRIL